LRRLIKLPESAIAYFEEINDVAWNLSGDQVHMVVQNLEYFPEYSSVHPEEYLSMLVEYADLLEEAGESEKAENVHLVRTELIGN